MCSEKPTPARLAAMRLMRSLTQAVAERKADGFACGNTVRSDSVPWDGCSLGG